MAKKVSIKVSNKVLETMLENMSKKNMLHFKHSQLIPSRSKNTNNLGLTIHDTCLLLYFHENSIEKYLMNFTPWEKKDQQCKKC